MKLKLIAVLFCISGYSALFGSGYSEIFSSYRVALSTPGGELPFELELRMQPNGSGVFTIFNGSEQISNGFTWSNKDSFDLNFPVFNTYLRIIFTGENMMDEITGNWYDKSRPGNYFLPVKGSVYLKKYRFIHDPILPAANISGRWTTIFSDESSSEETVGIFKQTGNHLSGTFLTTTGDYRFLEGEVSADSFYLSAFDGSHAFLFKGKINSDGSLSGAWWSGKHYSATFIAKRNDNAKLPDPKTLTYLKPEYKKIDFSFPDENGKIISLQDAQFKDKVIVIQITGSWCPNCMDETSYLSEVEEKYKNTDLSIVALSFERQPDSINFKKNIEKEKKHFGVEYTFLNAGLPRNASDALPMLNKVMSFPTTIILDKNHDVVEIYTGFSGPATGDVFVEFRKIFEDLLDKLLAQ